MGCNTSQELKTKEGSTTAVNGSAQNEDNATCEQNCNNEDAQQQQKGAVSGDLQNSQQQTTTNHMKTNSIISNGSADNSHHSSQSYSKHSSANTVKQNNANSINSSHTISPAKENGSLLLKQQIQSYNKAELTEFKDMDEQEDEGESPQCETHSHI